LNSIPIESAHPNFDHAERIILFHNGSISNFTDLKASLSVMGIKIPANINLDNLTDS
jgi:glucosamine 6-phosphate synthetase-like amidotransferase/phosphosugar isomerase protein